MKPTVRPAIDDNLSRPHKALDDVMDDMFVIFAVGAIFVEPQNLPVKRRVVSNAAPGCFGPYR